MVVRQLRVYFPVCGDLLLVDLLLYVSWCCLKLVWIYLCLVELSVLADLFLMGALCIAFVTLDFVIAFGLFGLFLGFWL